MTLNTKIKAFTLSEMIVVLILTSIVVGIAFSVLTLVQKHMNSIQNNFNNTTQLNFLEQSLTIDFNRFSEIEYDPATNVLLFSNELETKTYTFSQDYIVKDVDTFPIPLEAKTLFFNGLSVEKGKIDAIKLETTKTLQNKLLFVFKTNAATSFMN